jgi:hypothetical protein
MGSIVRHNGLTGSLDLSLGATTNKDIDKGTKDAAADTKEKQTQSQSSTTTAPVITDKSENKSDEYLDSKFQRLLVFGFRSLIFVPK